LVYREVAKTQSLIILICEAFPLRLAAFAVNIALAITIDCQYLFDPIKA